VLGLAITWVLFVPAADWLARHDVASAAGSLHETAVDNARGRLLTLGAGLFAAGALVFTARNFTVSRRTLELTEQGQVTDRYTKAIEQLGSEKLDVRIGGIYALERITRDSPRDHPTVMEVLTAFIREHSHEQWPPSDHPAGRGPERSTRPDVQAALTVVGRRDPDRDIRRIDLTGADLTRADFTDAILFRAHVDGATLDGATLFKANLDGATLASATLLKANLTRAHLASATLFKANLTGAALTRADLTGADLTGAALLDAHLDGASLDGADLTVANLDNTDLTGATLTGATLTGADLTSATLTRADLTGADLTSATLTEAKLIDADLTNADLTGAILTGAMWPADAPVPEGWTLDPSSGRLE